MTRRYYAVECVSWSDAPNSWVDRSEQSTSHFYSREERDAWVAQRPDKRRAISANEYRRLVG